VAEEEGGGARPIAARPRWAAWKCRTTGMKQGRRGADRLGPAIVWAAGSSEFKSDSKFTRFKIDLNSSKL
jgi:hypothetical protein